VGLDSWCKGRSTAPRKEPEVSQSNTTQAQVAETLTQGTRTSIRQVRTRTHRRYAPEDKTRIVLEGSRLKDVRP